MSESLAPPLAILAELTHRCPLQCPYCSNPLDLVAARRELSTDAWKRVIDEAATLGVLQIHFSGGEPAVRRDLDQLVGHACRAGLYTNLITSGLGLDRPRFLAVVGAGLDHVQLSIQDADAATAGRISHEPRSLDRKLQFAGWVREAGLPLTINAVVHRQNLVRLDAMLDLALGVGASRIEIAHVQYYGWAFLNRAALMPTRAQIEAATQYVERARAELAGRIVIDYVPPDYYARRPKACMGGWGRQFINVAPSGRALPCHAAESIAELQFDSVLEHPLAEIWESSPAFLKFRGTSWMPEPCASCDRREIDWGGCRCQALALTGSSRKTDPACVLSPDHATLTQLAETDAASHVTDFIYRRPNPLPQASDERSGHQRAAGEAAG